MRRSGRNSTRAFTLLEVLIASLLLAVMLAVSINLLRAGMSTSSGTVTQGIVQEEARHVVEAFVRELKDAGEVCTGWEVGPNPDPSTQYYGQDVGTISFSRGIGYDPALEMLQWGPVVTYEYEEAVGEEPGKLVRTEGGVRTAVCNYVSDFRVCYEPNDSVVTVTLAVQRLDPDSPDHFVRASYSTSVKLRN